MTRLWRTATAGLLGFVCFSFTDETLAAEGEYSLALAGGTRWVKGGDFGPAAELQLNRGIAESWLLLADAGASYQPSGDFGVLSAALGAGFRWDVVQWVPELTLRLQAYDFSGSGAPLGLTGFELGASATLGVDRLLTRNWAVGVVGQGHALFTAADHLRLPMLDAALRVRYQWD
jgi:hypothetical protein